VPGPVKARPAPIFAREQRPRREQPQHRGENEAESAFRTDAIQVCVHLVHDASFAACSQRT
jgi:hypothetical protein